MMLFISKQGHQSTFFRHALPPLQVLKIFRALCLQWVGLLGLNGLLIRSSHLSDGFIEFSFQWTYLSRCAWGKALLKNPMGGRLDLRGRCLGMVGGCRGYFYNVRFAKRPINTFSSSASPGLWLFWCLKIIIEINQGIPNQWPKRLFVGNVAIKPCDPIFPRIFPL